MRRVKAVETASAAEGVDIGAGEAISEVNGPKRHRR